jgi:antitoxin component YwqK of YwqJK toxin-antitoxin module
MTEKIKDGLHTEWFDSGQKKIEGIFKDGKPHGLHNWWYENGKVKKTETWENGIMGQYERYYENGQLEIEGYFKKGVQYIQNKYNRNNEIEVKNGYGVLKYEHHNLRPSLEKKGLTSKIEFPIKNGTKNGISTKWYGNGEVKETTTWENGIENGPSVGYHKSGKIKLKGNYKNGQMYGRWESKNEDGGCFTYYYE